MVHEARTGISTVTPDDGVVSQPATGCLQWICGLVVSCGRALRVQPRHRVHAFVPSMTSMVIAAGLGPGNVQEGQRVIWQRPIRAPPVYVCPDDPPTRPIGRYTRFKLSDRAQTLAGQGLVFRLSLLEDRWVGFRGDTRTTLLSTLNSRRIKVRRNFFPLFSSDICLNFCVLSFRVDLRSVLPFFTRFRIAEMEPANVRSLWKEMQVRRRL